MTERVMVYVELLDEGVETWRPVLAIREGGEIYRLPEEQDETRGGRSRPALEFVVRLVSCLVAWRKSLALPSSKRAY
jgi:hypothetical protein